MASPAAPQAASGHDIAAPPSSVMKSPPVHSITSSAVTSSLSGTVKSQGLGGLQVDHELELGR